jgi:hypothetical protein
MKTIHSNAYDLVNSLGEEQIPKLTLDRTSGLYTTPYREMEMRAIENSSNKLKMYDAEDVAFVNTSLFSETGKYFQKTGKYTKAHPLYDKAEYDAFWNEEERRCKEGMTVPGKLITKSDGSKYLQEVHITGEHYGYLNYGEIKRSKEFELKKGILLGPGGEKIGISHNGGHTKSFDLPAFWDGDYYLFKALELCRQVGKHLVIGKARRKGYSYKNGWLVANKANLYRRSTSVVGAYDEGSLFDDGTMVKVMNFLDHINKHTDWKKRRIHNRLDHIEIGYRLKGDEVKRGYLSNIYTAILRTNPGGMRGKDADLLLLEEAGKCPNLSAILDATLKTLSDGIYTTGTMIVFGTGGGDEKYWQDFEDLFYEAYTRQFIMFNNKWDDDMEGTGCGYFHPSFMNKPGLVDAHGNSDIQGTLAFTKMEKQNLLSSPTKLNAYEMEEPEKPAQAFSRSSNNMFHPREVNDQLRRVLNDPELKGIGREGVFVNGDKGIYYLDRTLAIGGFKDLIKPSLTNVPLREDDKDLTGCWTIIDQPYRDANGNIPENLYHVWNDPFAISKEKSEFKLTDSLGSIYIYEATNNLTKSKGDKLVAWYHGRTEDSADFNEQLFMGALYYNSKILYENDRGDVFTHAQQKGLLHLLKDEPEFQFQKELSKGGQGRKKGISIAANMNRKANGLIYLKDWLIQKRNIGIDGKSLLNLHYIYDVGLLRELLKFNGKGNFDRISAMIVGMYDVKETIFKQIVPTSTTNDDADSNYFNSALNSDNPTDINVNSIYS